MHETEITLASILRFGDPRLESTTHAVDFPDSELNQNINHLREALVLFQQHYKWGRSIAAPQIGIMKCIVAINTPHLPSVLINPEIIWHSTETQLVWDDCMSLPEIAVEVERWKHITVKYQTIDGDIKFLENLSPQDSELLQHEIDHLSGIIMTHRMTSAHRVISRELRTA